MCLLGMKPQPPLPLEERPVSERLLLRRFLEAKWSDILLEAILRACFIFCRLISYFDGDGGISSTHVSEIQIGKVSSVIQQAYENCNTYGGSRCAGGQAFPCEVLFASIFKLKHQANTAGSGCNEEG